MRTFIKYLLLLVCLLYTVSCHQTSPGHYFVMLKDDAQLHEHIAWANKINNDSDSGHHGVQDFYECPLGKGYFAHVSGKTARAIEQSDEVLHLVPESTWSLQRVQSSDEIIVDKRIDPKNWALTAISSKPPTREGPYKYHKTQATGTYIYVVDTGIQSDDKEFQGRVVPGWALAPEDDPKYWEFDSNYLDHGTYVAGMQEVSVMELLKMLLWLMCRIPARAVIKGLCWAADDILKHDRANKSVINLSVTVGEDCSTARKVLYDLANLGITVVAGAGNDGKDAKTACLAGSKHVITVGAYDEYFNAANFSNHGTGIDVWAPGAGVRSLRSKAVLDELGRHPYPDDMLHGTSFAAPHVSGMIAGWMGETEEGLTPKQAREKLKELSHEDLLHTSDFMKCGVPQDEWEYRLANNRMAYNGADV
ncbi:unnamed protein product [Clonostachys rosea]|uniref:Peptidase S8/S53 domain-containing protein n=1 Tax=Bionectria ochroleuca TaxID=29856 RepID=A0ABY6TSH3_BIOOC|nr:unnamed protein product [Clonostachys rosea]